jgi:Kef-type K+ transport system membrane component KefB
MEHHSLKLLESIALSISFATVCGHVARLLKQPLMLGYVVGGILLGVPMGFGLVAEAESIELISEIGLLFLLFIIGLEINLKELLRMGKSMLALGFFQFVGCAGLAFLVFSFLLGNRFSGPYDMLYLSVTVAISSTLIVVKLLADKFELQTTAGRLTVGVLVLQDIWAMMFLTFQPNLLNPEWLVVLKSLALGVLLVAATFWVSGFILARVFHRIAKKPELVLLTAITWCFLLSGLAQKAGLSREMGALIAGLSIAAYPYGTDVIAKLVGIRDFFVTLFFVSLGLKMPMPDVGLCFAAFCVAGVVLISRLLTVAPIIYLSKGGLRIGLVTALNLSQISEFSLVIVALGLGYAHISPQLQTLVLTSMLLTSVMGTYLILFNNSIAIFLLKWAGKLTPSHMRDRGRIKHDEHAASVVLLGCFREGLAFLEAVELRAPQLKTKMLVVDFNQALAERLTAKGFYWSYGDLAHVETLEHLGLEKAQLVICSLSDTYLKGTTSSRLLAQIKKIAPHAEIIMTADDRQTGEDLKKSGAVDVVVSSHVVGNEIFTLVQKHLPF